MQGIISWIQFTSPLLNTKSTPHYSSLSYFNNNLTSNNPELIFFNLNVLNIYKIFSMPPAIDPAILKALNLDVATTTIASHGGSGFSSTAKLTSKVFEKDKDGKETETEKMFFVKMGKGKESEVMFAGK